MINTKVIRNTNFGKDGKLDLSDIASLEVEVNQLNNRQLEKGDIIIEKSGGSETQAVGRVVLFNLMEKGYSFSNFTARLRNKTKNVNSEFLYLVLDDFYNKGYTFPYQSGSSGIKNLDLQRYLDIKTPIPPKDIQRNIVTECGIIDEVTKTSLKLIEEAKNEIEKKIETASNKYLLKTLSTLVKTNP